TATVALVNDNKVKEIRIDLFVCFLMIFWASQGLIQS
ncbi:hypothetical protein D043_1635B, partial [Vibrio parahaemolyticus EKP-021]